MTIGAVMCRQIDNDLHVLVFSSRDEGSPVRPQSAGTIDPLVCARGAKEHVCHIIQMAFLHFRGYLMGRECSERAVVKVSV
jgi:hypothetical protein